MRADSPNAKAMDNKLLLSLLVPALDNRTLAILSRTPLWLTISELVNSDYYWYQRVQHLSAREIRYRPGDWKTAYYLLSEAIHLRDPFVKWVAVSPIAVSVLIEIGFDPTYSRILCYSVLDSHLETVRLLLKDGRSCPVSPYGDDLLRLAAGRGQSEMVRLLLEDGRFDPTADNSYTLRLAATRGHAEAVRLLLEDGRVDPRAEDSRVLKFAAVRGLIEVVRLLLEDGRADPRADNSHALRFAAGRGQIEVVRLLLEDGRSDDSSALRQAAARGHMEVVRLLRGDS